jgi:hypothetical protein
MKPVYSIIASQIGYRPCDPKRAFVRCDGDTAIDGAAELWNADTESCEQEGLPVAYWGEKWGVHFWVVDFSAWKREGAYDIRIPAVNARSNVFRIHTNIYIDETLIPVSVGQLDPKMGDKMGWQDCGSDLRAVEGHALQLLGLIDSYALRDRMTGEIKEKAVAHIRRGAEYLMACRREDGSFVNELYVEQDKRNWTLCMLAVVSLARAHATLGGAAYLDAAKRGWDWGAGTGGYTREERASDIDNTRKIYGKYPPWLPPAALRTRDRLLLIWAGTALYRSTNDLRYRDRAVEEARFVCGHLQVLDGTALESGLYGFFRVWEDREEYQKGWEHAGWGYGCGAVLPDELTGFFNLIELFPEDADYHRWVYTLRQYAYGYMLPASRLSPFGIMPLGVFEDRVMFFGPSWHGFNGMYGRYARLAMQMARFFEDIRFQEIATACLQWVMGLNTGVPSDGGKYEGLSWISGVGAHAVQAWTGIQGSICNGFCASPQFEMAHLDDIEDAPAYVTGEEWIVHNGGFLSGLAEIEKPYTLKIKTQYRGKPVDAGVRVLLDTETQYGTGPRGFIRIDALPVGHKGEALIAWEGVEMRYPIETIAGLTKVIPVDFSDCFTAHMELEEADGCLVITIANMGKDAAELSAFVHGIGIEIPQSEGKVSIKKSGTKALRFPYKETAQNQPLWARAYVTGRYHGAICEYQWRLENKEENVK